MLDALDASGRLSGVHAVLTGYLPTIEHVRFAAEAASRVSSKNSAAQVYCDPVFGDDPGGLYLKEAVAKAIRDELLPLADMAFPNRFELGWLSGQPVSDIGSAIGAANDLRIHSVLATSIPGTPGDLVNLWVSDGEAIICPVRRMEQVPHGTGDLLTALFIGHRLNGGLGTDHFSRAVAGVAAALTFSQGHNELQLAIQPEAWANPKPFSVHKL